MGRGALWRDNQQSTFAHNTQAQATQPLHRGPPSRIPTAFQHSTPRPSARSTVVRRPAICSTQALATADKAAPRGATARTWRARADPNKATAADENARVGQVASIARGGDGERSRRGERGR